MPTTTYAGLRYPQNSDGPYGPQQVQNLATDVDTKVIVPVASSSARTALTGVPAGLMVYEQSTKRYYYYDGSAWQYAGGAPPPIVAANAGAGWSNGSTAPGAFRDSSGIVHLVGSVNNNTAYNPQDGTSHTAAQLPAGYFPKSTVHVTIPIGNAFLTGWIDTGGLVTIVGGSLTTVPVNFSHPLEQITFHPGYAGAVPLS